MAVYVKRILVNPAVHTHRHPGNWRDDERLFGGEAIPIRIGGLIFIVLGPQDISVEVVQAQMLSGGSAIDAVAEFFRRSATAP